MADNQPILTDKYDVFGRRIRVGDFVVAFNEYKSYRGTLYYVDKDNPQKLSLVGIHVPQRGFVQGRDEMDRTEVALEVARELRYKPWPEISEMRRHVPYGPAATSQDLIVSSMHWNTKYGYDLLVVNELIENFPSDFRNPTESQETVLDILESDNVEYT